MYAILFIKQSHVIQNAVNHECNSIKSFILLRTLLLIAIWFNTAHFHYLFLLVSTRDLHSTMYTIKSTNVYKVSPKNY